MKSHLQALGDPYQLPSHFVTSRMFFVSTVVLLVCGALPEPTGGMVHSRSHACVEPQRFVRFHWSVKFAGDDRLPTCGDLAPLNVTSNFKS